MEDEYGPIVADAPTDQLQAQARSIDKTAKAIEGMHSDDVASKVEAMEKLYQDQIAHPIDVYLPLPSWLRRFVTEDMHRKHKQELTWVFRQSEKILRSMILELALGYQKAQNDLRAAKIQLGALDALNKMVEENATMRRFLMQHFERDLQTAEVENMPLRNLEMKLLLELETRRAGL